MTIRCRPSCLSSSGSDRPRSRRLDPRGIEMAEKVEDGMGGSGIHRGAAVGRRLDPHARRLRDRAASCWRVGCRRT